MPGCPLDTLHAGRCNRRNVEYSMLWLRSAAIAGFAVLRPALALLAVFALSSCMSSAEWAARNCRDKAVPEDTPQFQGCVQQEMADLRQTWAELDAIRRQH